MTLANIFTVFIGAGIGGALRYLCGILIPSSAFPVATLCVNVCGCLLIGLLSAVFSRFNYTGPWQLLLVTGLCGGFTTFSTFSNENILLLRSGNYLPALAYTTASIALGFLAVVLGYWAVNTLTK